MLKCSIFYPSNLLLDFNLSLPSFSFMVSVLVNMSKISKAFDALLLALCIGESNKLHSECPVENLIVNLLFILLLYYFAKNEKKSSRLHFTFVISFVKIFNEKSKYFPFKGCNNSLYGISNLAVAQHAGECREGML